MQLTMNQDDLHDHDQDLKIVTAISIDDRTYLIGCTDGAASFLHIICVSKALMRFEVDIGSGSIYISVCLCSDS
jgi:hypothetical protein